MSASARGPLDPILRPRAVPLQVGARVEVTRGPFAGLLAVVDRPSTPAGRIHVLLDLLKRKTRLELPVSAVALA
jgi:transcription antitermination factor NusG